MSSAQITTDHETIKQWAKARGGKPAEVEGTTKDGPGALRIEFADTPGGGKLKRLQWPSLLQKLDEEGFALLYREKTEQGEDSRFCKFIYAPRGVLALIQEEHERIHKILDSLEGTTTQATKTRPRLLQQLRELLLPHMSGEEKVVYKALKRASQDEKSATTILESLEEHRHTKMALERLEKADPESPAFSARLKVLKELVEHHIEEEQTELFDAARNLLGEDGLAALEDHYGRREEKTLAKL